MSEPSSSPTPDPNRLADLRSELLESAQRLRRMHHLDAEERARLGELIEELSQSLDPNASPESAALVADRAAALARAVHDHHEEGVIASTRERLYEAIAHADADAPWATSIVRRFLDMLAQIGI